MLLIKCLLGISSFSYGLSVRSEENTSFNDNIISNVKFISDKNYKVINIANKKPSISKKYSILNPNLLDINGPDVTLVFKKTEAKQNNPLNLSSPLFHVVPGTNDRDPTCLRYSKPFFK